MPLVNPEILAWARKTAGLEPAEAARKAGGHDFRTTTTDAPPQEQAWLDVVIRDVRARHALVRAALEEDEDALPVDFVGGSTIQEGVEVVAARVVELLGFDRTEFRRRPTLTEAFAVRRHRLGPALLDTVNDLLRTGGVSVVKAAKILGVRPSNVQETLAVLQG